MRFTTSRETLLACLERIGAIVERTQTMPVLSNVLLDCQEDGSLCATTTDMEIDMIARTAVEVTTPGRITVSAKKLIDILKALQDGTAVHVDVPDHRMVVTAGRSRFMLATLPADMFPTGDDRGDMTRIALTNASLKHIIGKASFAMANQDARHFLNGMLLEIGTDQIVGVATDGHRLSMASTPSGTNETRAMILPRKAVLTIDRLIDGSDDELNIVLGERHIRFEMTNLVFTTRLIDGRFPEFRAVIPPQTIPNAVQANVTQMRAALQRLAILADGKTGGIRLELKPDQIRLQSNNPEQEEAVEIVDAQYQGQPMVLGFCVKYLLDVLSVIGSEEFRLAAQNGDTSARVYDLDDESVTHVLMPLRL